jgi:hypothetical protein
MKLRHERQMDSIEVVSRKNWKKRGSGGKGASSVL